MTSPGFRTVSTATHAHTSLAVACAFSLIVMPGIPMLSGSQHFGRERIPSGHACRDLGSKDRMKDTFSLVINSMN